MSESTREARSRWRRFEANERDDLAWPAGDTALADSRVLSRALARTHLDAPDGPLLLARLEWALLAAAYASYEAELVRLAFPPRQAVGGGAQDAIRKLRGRVRTLVSNEPALRRFVTRLDGLQHAVATGGANPGWVARKKHVEPAKWPGVDYFLRKERVHLVEHATDASLACCPGQFEALIRDMAQVLVVVRAGAAVG